MVVPKAVSRLSRPDFDDVSIGRRRNMAAIAGKDTQPEMVIRRALHGMGFRYRLHVAGLPGRPDIVFAGRRKVIEIRGCFWHRHPGCARTATPATRREFWQAKFNTTIARDARNLTALEAAGWSVLVIWECEIGDADLAKRLQCFLGPPARMSIPLAR